MVVTKTWTAQDLWQRGSELEGFELYEGVLEPMPAAGRRHGEIEVRIASMLFVHVNPMRLGAVYPGDTGCVFARDPDTVLVPDIAFVAADNLPPAEQRVAFLDVVPDIVFEISSPSDRPKLVEDKIRLYEQARVPLIVTIDSVYRTAVIRREGEAPASVDARGMIALSPVLPELTLAMDAIFATFP